MSINSNPSPKLINDAPAVEDRLGAHKRIADTLCEIVTSNKGGKTIALEGEWGAGKSTVVNLMTQSLEESKDFKVVIYDAWVHSGDPLRRAFLNSVIDALLENKWLKDESYWTSTKEQLSRRKKDSEKKSTPIFTPFGQILLLFMLLLPLAGVVFSGLYMSLAKSGFTDFQISSATGIGLLISGCLSILPFLLVLSRAIYAWCSGNQSNDWALILNKSSVTESTSTIETPDPTTIEFQNVFQEVVTKSLDGNTRKLMLVIDNLDRLPQEEAELVWSMLRSFIDNPAYKMASWQERLWIVVPVASNSAQETDEKQTIKNEKFLEKVFQVRISLPPPVLADWKQYLISLLEKAFAENEKEYFSDIHRIYEAHIQETRKGQLSPTPRELVIFTNELVTLKMQWRDKFNLSYLAAYLLATRNKNVLSALQQREIPSLRTLRLLNATDVTKEFATIYFNVEDVNKAQQLLLRPVFENALTRGDGIPLLDNLIADNSAEHVIESVLGESLGDWAHQNPDLFFNTLTALNHVENHTLKGELSSRQFNFSKDFKNYVSTQGISAIRNWPALPVAIENCSTGISDFLELIQENEVEHVVIDAIKRMSGAYYTSQTVQNQIVPHEDNIGGWLKGFGEIIKNPRITPLLPSESSNSIKLPIPPKLWGKYCHKLGNDECILPAFIPDAGLDQLKNHIIEISIKQAKFNWDDFHAIKHEELLSNTEFVNSVITSISPQIYSQQTLPSVFLESTLWTILFLAEDNEVCHSKLSEIVNSGWLHHHLHAMVSQQENECAAILATSILKIRPGATLPVAVGNGNAGQNIIQKIVSASSDMLPIANEVATNIGNLSMHRLLIDMSIDAPTATGFISHANQKLSKSEEDQNEIYSSFSLSSVDNFADEVRAFANAAKTESMDSLAIQRDVVHFNIQNRDLLTLLIQEQSLELTNIVLYNIALTEGGKSNKKYIEKCINILNNINEATWGENISAFTWTVKTVTDLLNHKTKPKLGEPLRNALLNLAKSATKPSAEIKIETKHLISLVNALADVHKHSFADDVFGIVSQQGIVVSPTFWEKFGFAVSNAAQRLSIKGRTVRTVVRPMISRCDIPGLKWFATLLKESGIKQIDDDEIAINDLVGAAISYIHQSGVNAEMADSLREIVILLGHEDKLVTE